LLTEYQSKTDIINSKQQTINNIIEKGEITMSVLTITKDNFENEIIKSDKPVLLDFWAAWCGPCKMVSPVIDEIAGEMTNAKVGKINVDEQPELANAFKIMSIPTLAVVKDGKVVKTSVGVKAKKDIINMLNG
jgi:thioredoxin 1